MERPARDAAKKCCVKIENNAKRDGGHQSSGKEGLVPAVFVWGEKKKETF